MKLERLFEREKRPSVRNLENRIAAEIDAVATRKKGIAVYWPQRSDIGTQHFFDQVQRAYDHGLTVVLDARHMFIVREEEMWRIPAIRALGGMCNTAARSTLFGYTPAQIRAYLEEERWRRPFGPYGEVYYVLLTSAQRADVVALGNKAFRDPTGLLLFEAGVAIRRDAITRIPKALTLARLLMPSKFGWKIVGDKAKRRLPSTVFSGRVSTRHAKLVNAALASPIEFLTARGWV